MKFKAFATLYDVKKSVIIHLIFGVILYIGRVIKKGCGSSVLLSGKEVYLHNNHATIFKNAQN